MANGNTPESLSWEPRVIEGFTENVPTWLAMRAKLVRSKVRANVQFAQENNPFAGQGIFALPNIEKQFDFTGTAFVSEAAFETALAQDENLKEFYSKDGRCFVKGTDPTPGDPSGKSVYLNGYNHICSRDENLDAPTILEILFNELEDSISIAKKIQNGEIEVTPENVLFYASILQSGKNSILTFFNALIIKEKKGDFQSHNGKYQAIRLKLRGLLSDIIETTYRVFSGQPIPEDINLDAALDGEARMYLQNNVKFTHFSRPESIHPLSMMASTFNNAVKYPNIDTVVSMPAGGTELAVLQTLVHEEVNGRKPELLILPISLHTVSRLSEESIEENGSLTDYVERRRKKIEGKKMLVIDDNSSTGRTLQLAAQQLGLHYPESIDTAVSEADLTRSLLRINSDTDSPIANPDVYNGASAILPVVKHIKGHQNWDLKSVAEIRVVEKYYKQKQASPNANTLTKILEQARGARYRRSTLNSPNTINKFRGTFLSNFAPVEITRNDITYPSVEHAYQAAKYEGIDLASILEENPEICTEINNAFDKRHATTTVTPQNVCEIFTDPEVGAGKIKIMMNVLGKYILPKKDWYRGRLELMLELTRQKFLENEEYSQQLRKTNGHLLIEGNTWGDEFWGVNLESGRGHNFLGKILIEVRSEAKKHHRSQCKQAAKVS